jgi:hypothetical protein
MAPRLCFGQASCFSIGSLLAKSKQIVSALIQNGEMPDGIASLFHCESGITHRQSVSVRFLYKRNSSMGQLYELKRRYNKYICLEPNAFPLSELDNDNPFVKEILRTGREIT